MAQMNMIQIDQAWDMFVRSDMSVPEMCSELGICEATFRKMIKDKSASLGIHKQHKTYFATTFRMYVRKIIRIPTKGPDTTYEKHTRKTLGLQDDSDLVGNTNPSFTKYAIKKLGIEENHGPAYTVVSEEYVRLEKENRELIATLRNVASALQYLNSIKEKYSNGQ